MSILYEKQPLNIDTIEDPKEHKAATLLFLKALLEKIYGDHQKITQRIVDTRWQPLHDEFKYLAAWEDKELCHVVKHVTPEYLAEKRNIDLNRDVAFTLRRLKRLQMFEGDIVSDKLADVQAIRDIEVEDFVETLIA
eukprot:CAMPEP_0168514538 /NCGR_PEP_ID=MMETSP0405-20121227/4175_1 /TAXON_ID=498012 /ORGANISM="Trichosphaerium sp, Strain Am-I-7 wt" /LENGTH=136 /DNA_ID=CAMNT_0008533695 /DNA_START=105 /DNA_END=511 /DNA_ORIENTATION=+